MAKGDDPRGTSGCSIVGHPRTGERGLALVAQCGELEAAGGSRGGIDAQHDVGMLEPCMHPGEGRAARPEIGGLRVEVADRDPDKPRLRTRSIRSSTADDATGAPCVLNGRSPWRAASPATFHTTSDIGRAGSTGAGSISSTNVGD